MLCFDMEWRTDSYLCACANDCHKLLIYDLPSIVKTPLLLFANDTDIFSQMLNALA